VILAEHISMVVLRVIGRAAEAEPLAKLALDSSGVLQRKMSICIVCLSDRRFSSMCQS
jgi:hypothetical protein